MGTSDYQAAWLLDADEDDEGDSEEDQASDDEQPPQPSAPPSSATAAADDLFMDEGTATEAGDIMVCRSQGCSRNLPAASWPYVSLQQSCRTPPACMNAITDCCYFTFSPGPALARPHPDPFRTAMLAWLCNSSPSLRAQDEDEYNEADRTAFEERKRLQQAQQDHLQFPDEVCLPLLCLPCAFMSWHRQANHALRSLPSLRPSCCLARPLTAQLQSLKAQCDQS